MIRFVISRSIDDRNGFTESRTDVSFKERLRRIVPLNVIMPVFVNILKIEAAGRLAVTAAEITVNFIQYGNFVSADLFQFAAGSCHFADVDGSGLERLIEQAVHQHRVFTLSGFRHRVLGNNAVFCNEIFEHIPLPAVMDAGRENVGDDTVVGRKSYGFDDGFKKEIGPFKLIPESGVALGQFERSKSLFLCNLFT